MEFLGVLVLVVSFIILLSLGVPIAFSIGISGILTMLVSIDSLPAFTTFAHRMATGLDSFALLAIPFFILAGNIMNHGGIAIKLIDFARVIVGRLPGGLAFVNVLANMLFGAISGSAAASASAIGTIMGPEMEKEGYDKSYSTAINVTSATTGLSIPPSNILIVYSLASGGASIAALFMAGYIPGILTGLSLMLVGAIFAIRRKYAVSKENTVADVFLTLIHLFITVLMAYVFIDSNLHWSYLVIFYTWIRALSAAVYKKAGKIKWELPLVGFTSLVIAVINLNTLPAFLIPLVIMTVIPLFMNRVKIWHLIAQAFLVLIAINLYDEMHWITSGFLFLEIVILFTLRLEKAEEIYDNFKGTKKYFAAIPSLLLLVVVIGGIIAGIFTATEASAVAVLYALILAFTYRELNFKTVPVVLINAVRTTSIVLLLVAASIGLSWIMSFENIPQNVSEALLALSDNKFVILLIINLILLFVGIFMDMTPAVLIFTPIFLPIVTNLGLDPVHFGIIMVLNLSVGLCTPPVGSVLFIGCSVSNISIDRVVKPLIPLFIAMITVLMLVTYWPALSLWLPGLLGF